MCSIAIGKHGTCTFAFHGISLTGGLLPALSVLCFLASKTPTGQVRSDPRMILPVGATRLGVCELIDPLAVYQSPPAVLPWSKVRDLTCSSKQDVEECTAPALPRELLRVQVRVGVCFTFPVSFAPEGPTGRGQATASRETRIVGSFFPLNFELRPVR